MKLCRKGNLNNKKGNLETWRETGSKRIMIKANFFLPWIGNPSICCGVRQGRKEVKEFPSTLNLKKGKWKQQAAGNRPGWTTSEFGCRDT